MAMTIAEAKDILLKELEPDAEVYAAQTEVEDAMKIAVQVLEDVLHGDLKKYE